ncbi:MAG: hypothetical protein GY798_26310 [Hyphomicrobiales bacterium]|nr:hypothetical protein [Hyphomicrobiales bacterium]
MNLQIHCPETVDHLRDEACRLDCTPQQLATLILDICLGEDLVDAVLDGEKPAEVEAVDDIAS